MLAPKIATAEVKAGGETIILRLNFFSISLLEDAGIDILNDAEPPSLSNRMGLTFLKCLALEEQPYFTEDHAATLTSEAKEGVAEALVELFSKYAGKDDGSGNRKGRRAAKSAARAKTTS